MINKVSEITENNIAEYIRLVDASKSELSELKTYLNIAISFIISYTGLNKEELDEYNDLIIVVYVLCQDMYDNRTLYVEKNNLNKVVETVLGMHSRNLL